MVSPLAFLVFDGNTEAVNDRSRALGGVGTGKAYARVLQGLCGDLGRVARCVVVAPADNGAGCLPVGVALEDFDAIVWTGSALNVYAGGPEVEAQIEFARAAFDSAAPVFGSCWGLQVMTAALGGVVRANPKGREIGIGRAITLTDIGRGHPMYRGKPGPFDAITVHLDEIETAPPGGVVLAANAVSAIQGMDIRQGKKSFWGVQYHPEFDLAEIARVHQRYGSRLIDEGFFGDARELETYIDGLFELDGNPEDAALAQKMRIGIDVLDPVRRMAELRNWIAVKVIGDEAAVYPR
ncbi:type 1 glutamine amidotransferase [Varunaivibrio sulfuroxidans]|uniref:GMP synthase (Glutamine-hydrolysing) n=1 Tax=Varunaivibrio sulfuroxidans TaxID=1773489 RepID=A0A4R3JCN2_9PROT|nr:type 1 glutamine amidotransferase [Varunaivibrio sulfuroxidans]TCS63427.1 GMP synthase (glutamine-hydrolysing) [Varunaivibrio sulfuroxidans]WES30427.1 type 1 glutamine amidotransferase [Varunaivibrio sulfuroxidans]